MAMKKSWFSLVKRLFIWDSHSTTQDKKEKRRKWVFGRIKSKRLATIGAPPAALSREKTTKLSEAEEEQSKHALTVAFASAAAAEAAVAAAQVAAEVVLLTGVPQSSHKLNKEKSQEEEEESQTAKTRNADPHYTNQSIKEFAAIKIQTSFRGYLARKALRALKGIVKLQAIIRGRAVRRQAMSTLKCLQSIVSIQSQVCARRLKMAEGKWDYIAENEEMLQDSKDKIIRMDLNSERKWDDSTLLKEEVYASCISKKEAALKRERIKEYSFNHRRSAETERSKVNGRWRYWMEQWVDTQLSKSKELEDLDSVFSSNSRVGDEHGLRHLKLRNMQNNNREGLDSAIVLSRKGFPHHRRQCSVGEDSNNNNNNNNCSSFSSSPVTPAYMAATESARAKARSTSSPRVRTGNLECESFSPCKKKISINSEVLRNGKFCATQQRSPSFKGISVPIKSRGTTVIKDLSINSDCSLPNWDRQSSFK